MEVQAIQLFFNLLFFHRFHLSMEAIRLLFIFLKTSQVMSCPHELFGMVIIIIILLKLERGTDPWQVSNPRPLAYEGVALFTKPHRNSLQKQAIGNCSLETHILNNYYYSSVQSIMALGLSDNYCQGYTAARLLHLLTPIFLKSSSRHLLHGFPFHLCLPSLDLRQPCSLYLTQCLQNPRVPQIFCYSLFSISLHPGLTF